MTGWIGAVIASITVIVALTINPTNFIDGDELQIRMIFAGVLLGFAGCAFLLARKTPELLFSRHVSLWAAGLAVLAIGASNMDILTGTAKVTQVAVKPATIVPTITAARKKPNSGGSYVPDTSEINRVERQVEREESDLNSVFSFDDKEETPLSRRITNSEQKPSKDRQVSDEEKQKFEKFLATQGLTYDPDTAFTLRAEPDNSFAPAPPSSESNSAPDNQSTSPDSQKSNLAQ